MSRAEALCKLNANLSNVYLLHIGATLRPLERGKYGTSITTHNPLLPLSLPSQLVAIHVFL